MTAASIETFDATSCAAFSACYPETPHKLVHRLRDHPLLQLDALAALGEELPAHSVEYNRADLPIGLNGEKAPPNGIGIGETIRNIASTGSWAALKNVEQVPAYAALLGEVAGGIAPNHRGANGGDAETAGLCLRDEPRRGHPRTTSIPNTISCCNSWAAR